MQKFADNLAELEGAEHLQALELYSDDGSIAGIVENKAGSEGSFKLYHALWKKWGAITVEAANEGLELYAEHTQDAKDHPGKHPNIDRLLEVVALNKPLTLETIPVGDA